MNNVTIGEIIELDNGKKYLCFDQIKENEYRYLYLITQNSPVEVKFAKQNIGNDDSKIIIIGSKEEKKYVLELFQEKRKDIIK